MAQIKASREMLLNGARMSIAANLAAIAGFLKERHIPFKDFVVFMGEKLEDTFGDMAGRGADEVMEYLLNLKILPMGAEITSSVMTPDKAEVTLTSLPPRIVLEKFGTTPHLLLHDFGVTRKEFEAIFESYGPAMEAIGLKFKHHSCNRHDVLTLERIKGRTRIELKRRSNFKIMRPPKIYNNG